MSAVMFFKIKILLVTFSVSIAMSSLGVASPSFSIELENGALLALVDKHSMHGCMVLKGNSCAGWPISIKLLSFACECIEVLFDRRTVEPQAILNSNVEIITGGTFDARNHVVLEEYSDGHPQAIHVTFQSIEEVSVSPDVLTLMVKDGVHPQIVTFDLSVHPLVNLHDVNVLHDNEGVKVVRKFEKSLRALQLTNRTLCLVGQRPASCRGNSGSSRKKSLNLVLLSQQYGKGNQPTVIS